MSAAAAKPAAKTAPKKVADHPPFAVMVKAAVANLKARKGSSRQAIYKYVRENYKVSDNCSVHLRKALIKGVASGELVQASGAGASGCFKLAVVEKKPAKAPAAKKASPKKAAAPKKAAVKKTSSPKKAAAKKTAGGKTAAPKKVAAKKSPKKVAAKKTATPKKKTAAKKPKSPVKAKKPVAKKTAAKKPAAKKAVKK